MKIIVSHLHVKLALSAFFSVLSVFFIQVSFQTDTGFESQAPTHLALSRSLSFSCLVLIMIMQGRKTEYIQSGCTAEHRVLSRSTYNYRGISEVKGFQGIHDEKSFFSPQAVTQCIVKLQSSTFSKNKSTKVVSIFELLIMFGFTFFQKPDLVSKVM